jgi:hypothetical protein
MKNELINCYKKDLDLTKFYGKKEIIFDNSNNETVIFNFQNKTFPKNKYVHCQYSIKIGDISQQNLYLYFGVIKNTDSKEPRNLKFNYIIIFLVDDEADAVGSINHEELRKKS